MSSWRRPCWQKSQKPTPSPLPQQHSLGPSPEVALLCQRLRNDDPLLTSVTLDHPDHAMHITKALLGNNTVQDVQINVSRFRRGNVHDYRLAGDGCASRRPSLLCLEPILHYLQAAPQKRQHDSAQSALRKLELTCSLGAPQCVHLVDAILNALCEFPGSSDNTNKSNHRTVGQHIQELKLNDKVKASPAALEHFLANAPSSLHMFSFDLEPYASDNSSNTSVDEYEGVIQAFSHMTSTMTTLNLTSTSRHVNRVSRILLQLSHRRTGNGQGLGGHRRRPHVVNLSLDLHGTETSLPSRPFTYHLSLLFLQLLQHVMLERLTLKLTRLSESDVASLELINERLPNLSMFHVSLVEPVKSNVLIQALGTCAKLTHVLLWDGVQETSIEAWNSICATVEKRNVPTCLTLMSSVAQIEFKAELERLPEQAVVPTIKYTLRSDRRTGADVACLDGRVLRVLLRGGLEPSNIVWVVLAFGNCTCLYHIDTQKFDLTSLCCNRFDAEVQAFVQQEHLKSFTLSSGSPEDTGRLLSFVRHDETLQEVRAPGCTPHEERCLQAMAERNCKLPLLLLCKRTLPLLPPATTREHWQPDTSTIDHTMTLMPRLVRAAMSTPRVSFRYVLAGMLSLPGV